MVRQPILLGELPTDVVAGLLAEKVLVPLDLCGGFRTEILGGAIHFVRPGYVEDIDPQLSSKWRAEIANAMSWLPITLACPGGDASVGTVGTVDLPVFTKVLAERQVAPSTTWP